MEIQDKIQEKINDSLDSGTTLLFLDTLTHLSLCFNTDEILFKQPVILQQIRILKPEINPHPNLKIFQSYFFNFFIDLLGPLK